MINQVRSILFALEMHRTRNYYQETQNCSRALATCSKRKEERNKNRPARGNKEKNRKLKIEQDL
jgi:hypothetical protein